jgi:hypothetical protein
MLKKYNHKRKAKNPYWMFFTGSDCAVGVFVSQKEVLKTPRISKNGLSKCYSSRTRIIHGERLKRQKSKPVNNELRKYLVFRVFPLFIL